MDIDYRLAFDLAPVGLVLSRHRTMVDCNRAVCDMFGAAREQLVGQSFQILYPSADEYQRTGERIAPIMNQRGHYADDRLMKRLDGAQKGETFWCHVTGRALAPTDPHAAGIWSFEDLSARRPVGAALTPREREVLAMVTQGRPNKVIACALGVSESTVKVHRHNVMNKMRFRSLPELTLAMERLKPGQ